MTTNSMTEIPEIKKYKAKQKARANKQRNNLNFLSSIIISSPSPRLHSHLSPYPASGIYFSLFKLYVKETICILKEQIKG